VHAGGLLAVPPPLLRAVRQHSGAVLAGVCRTVRALSAVQPLVLQLLIYPGVAGRQTSASHRDFGHGFLLNRGQKESKSLGNVTDPLELAERFGVDALRYFLMREVAFGQDGSYSPEAIVQRANGELGNAFGNLAQRTLGFIAKNLECYLPAIRGHEAADAALFEAVDRAITVDIPDAFEGLALQQAVEAWLQAVFACNAYIDAQAPWTLRKTDPERMETVLATLYICIAQLAVAISPVIPASSAKLLDTLGIPVDLRNLAGIRSHWYSPLAESDYQIIAPAPLFPRLELPADEATSG
jgi:methionyl-tRNA synthetase